MEGLPPPKAQSVLLKRMESLEPVRHWIIKSKKLIAWFSVDGFFVQVEKENILAKMQGAETPNIAEQNQVGRNQGPSLIDFPIKPNFLCQVLMLLLKVSCEVRQKEEK